MIYTYTRGEDFTIIFEKCTNAHAPLRKAIDFIYIKKIKRERRKKGGEGERDGFRRCEIIQKLLHFYFPSFLFYNRPKKKFKCRVEETSSIAPGTIFSANIIIKY